MIHHFYASMQYLQEWRGRDKKKRAAEESNQESSRKRIREDTSNNDGRREDSIGNGVDVVTEEFKIRGSATSSPLPHHSPPISPATEPSIIHPDRRANIINATPDSATSPLPDKSDDPHSPSRSPEHISNEKSDEQRRKYLLS